MSELERGNIKRGGKLHNAYAGQTRVLLAVECIIFCFDGDVLKLLLVKPAFSDSTRWGFTGAFAGDTENPDHAAGRMVHTLTGIEGCYLEQLYTFMDSEKEQAQRTVSVVYFALIDINKYREAVDADYHTQWFELDKLPKLKPDHLKMVHMARLHIRSRAAFHPLLFELLPHKFTIPQIQNLYDSVYNSNIDKRNLSKRILSTGLLIKLPEKDKSGSKRGASYYQLHKQNYYSKFQSFLRLLPNINAFMGNR